MILRSLLVMPANQKRFLARLEAMRPDAVILDLEDSVAPAEKAAAEPGQGSTHLGAARSNRRAVERARRLLALDQAIRGSPC